MRDYEHDQSPPPHVAAQHDAVRGPRGSSVPTTVDATAGHALRLQRLAGNAAVAQLLAGGPPALQRAASRSVEVALQNDTAETLHQAATTLPHGVWRTKPPGVVKPRTTATWASESAGFMTGTEGSVDFSIEGAVQPVKFRWDNPFVGSNSAAESAPAGYKAAHFGGAGANAKLAFTLTSDRHVVTIGTEKVNVANDAEKAQAEAIIKAIKDDFGVTVSSSAGASAVQSAYTNAPAAVTGAVSVGVWELKELVALRAALAHFAPILGKLRAKSSRSGAAQEILTVGKVKQSIDTNSPSGVLDTTTLGEFFKSSQNFSMFDAGTKSTVDFTDTRKQLEGTAIHELAHGLVANELPNYVAALDYWTDSVTKSGKAGAEAPITTYGETNASEDLSEAVMFYFMDEAKLKAQSPKRHAFVKTVVASWTPPAKATP